MANEKRQAAHKRMSSVWGGHLCVINAKKLDTQNTELKGIDLAVPIYVYAINPIEVTSITKRTLNGTEYAVYNGNEKLMFPIGHLGAVENREQLQSVAFENAKKISDSEDLDDNQLVYADPELAVHVVKLLNEAGIERAKAAIKHLGNVATSLLATNESVTNWFKQI